MKKKKDFLSITDLSEEEIWQVLKLAKKLKQELKEKESNKPLLSNKQMVMLFEKPSLRTKLSFDIGFNQLGGHSLYFGSSEVGLGKREAVSDVAKVISSMADLIVARVFSHQDLAELAQNSKVPVINALSDLEHPCQILADFLTIWEIKDKLTGLTLAYVGDGENNITHSLCLGASMLGMKFQSASPNGFWMSKNIVKKAEQYKGSILQTKDPKEAVKNADVVITDVWVSMDDTRTSQRIKALAPYQVSSDLMKYAKKDAIFMHSLPAHREEEVTSKVVDGAQSVVFAEAENRLHVQKALMLFLLDA